MPLPVEHMDELELAGFIFCQSPPDLTHAEAREQLEAAITLAALDLGLDPEEDAAISPAWCHLVLFRRASREIAALTPSKRRAEIDALWTERAARGAEIALKRQAAADAANAPTELALFSEEGGNTPAPAE